MDMTWKENLKELLNRKFNEAPLRKEKVGTGVDTFYLVVDYPEVTVKELIGVLPEMTFEEYVISIIYFYNKMQYTIPNEELRNRILTGEGVQLEEFKEYVENEIVGYLE